MELISFESINMEHTIRWQITDACNFKCEGCYQEQHKNSTKIDLNFLLDIAKRLNILLCKIKEISDEPIRVYFVGGEPSLIPILEILKILDLDLIDKIQITTNLSNTEDYYNSIRDYCSKFNTKVILKASYHSTQINDKNEWWRKVKAIKVNQVLFVVRDETLDDIRNCVEFCKKEKIKFNINEHKKFILSKDGKHNIPFRHVSKQVRDFIHENMINANKNFRLTYNDGSALDVQNILIKEQKLFNPVGGLCNGFLNLNIDLDGIITTLFCYSKGAITASIFDDLSKIDLKPKICQTNVICNPFCKKIKVTYNKKTLKIFSNLIIMFHKIKLKSTKI